MLKQPSSEYKGFRARGIRLREERPSWPRCARWRRTGSPSSGDLSSVGIVVLLRQALLSVMEGVNRLRGVLLGLARQHPCPGLRAVARRLPGADDSLETPTVLALLYHSMAKWADDLILWSTSEFHFVDIPDRFCNTSSIMMQKKNVIGPAEVKGASAEALGSVVTSYHALKGPTGLPVTERYSALDQVWRVAANCARDLAWFCELLPALGIRREHMREQAWRHWATATDLAGTLVRERDLPWRTAHQIVGILVRLGEERGLGPDVEDVAAIQRHLAESSRRLESAIDEILKPAPRA